MRKPYEGPLRLPLGRFRTRPGRAARCTQRAPPVGDDLRRGVLVSQQLAHVCELPAGSLVIFDDLRQCVRSLPVGVVQKQHLVPLPFSPCLVRMYDAPQLVLGSTVQSMGKRPWSRTTFLNTGSASEPSK